MLPPRTRVGEYRVVRFVAEGKTSTVYEGRHSTRGGTVAIKVLNPEWCIHPEVVARFLNEAQTLQELHHPHLVKGLDRGVLREGPPFMVLEWQPEDLDRALTRVGGRLPARECAQVVRQLAEVLALLHVRGVVHRDLKPANVLVAHLEPGGSSSPTSGSPNGSPRWGRGSWRSPRPGAHSSEPGTTCLPSNGSAPRTWAPGRTSMPWGFSGSSCWRAGCPSWGRNSRA